MALLCANLLYAQKPNISYTTPQSLTAGQPVTLTPLNSGGAVSPSQYGQASIVAGNGSYGVLNGTGTSAGFAQPLGIVVDSAGNLYVSNTNIPNRPAGNNIISKITPAGVVTTFAGSGATGYADGQGTAAVFAAPGGLAIDKQGNIYVTDSKGPYGSGIIRKITPAGYVSTFAGGAPFEGTPTDALLTKDGQDTTAIIYDPKSITVDNAGNLYVTTSINEIRKISPSAYVSTLVSNATGQLYWPEGLTHDSVGNLYVADASNYRIVKVSPQGQVTAFAGYGTQGHNDGAGAAAIFEGPYGVARDEDGNLFVGDDAIRKITPAALVSTVLNNLPGSPAVAYYDGSIYYTDIVNNLIRKVVVRGSYAINGPALPDGLVFDVNTGIISGIPTTVTAAQTYYVTAYNSAGSFTTSLTIGINPAPAPAMVAAPNISYTSPQTYFTTTAITPLAPANSGGAVPQSNYGEVTVLAGGALPAGSAKDGSGTSASFLGPTFVAVDTIGNIYVADKKIVRRVTADGTVTTLNTSGTFSANPGSSAQMFPGLHSIAVDKTGDVYVAQDSLDIIQKISVGNGSIGPFAGNSNPYLYRVLDKTGSAATFYKPGGMAFNGSGNLFVPDDLFLIREITPSAAVSTFFFEGDIATDDEPYAPPTFYDPDAIAIDKQGNIYVTYPGNYVIYKTTPQKDTSTIDQGVRYTFSLPVPGNGLAVDASGNLYSSDPLNNGIDKYTPAGVKSLFVSGSIFGVPYGLAIDRDGDLIVADGTKLTIDKVGLTGYTIDSTLPAGLVFDGKTGIISGTPTATAPAKDYTITAYNVAGKSSYKISITVLSGTQPTVESIVPATAIAGETVTIKGHKFSNATAVSFGSVPARMFTVEADTVISAVVDTGATGSVSVTTPLGTGTLAGFIFVPVPAIKANGPVTFFVGDSVLLSAGPLTGFAYQWKNNGTPIPGATASTYTAKKTGSYTVTITVNSVSQTSAAVAVNAVFTLPANNFSVSATSATCRGTADGVINIAAVQNLDYTASITGNGVNTSYPFNTKLAINNLAAGTYDVCITVADEPGYQQCYNMEITQPPDLSVYATVDAVQNTVTLALSGADTYYIQLNGMSYTATGNSVTLPLPAAVANLQVTTDKICQGTFLKMINLSGNPDPYPNPFQNTLNVNIGSSQVNKVNVEIYDVTSNELVYTKQYANQSGVLQLDVSNLANGVYALRLALDSSMTIFKVFKR